MYQSLGRCKHERRLIRPDIASSEAWVKVFTRLFYAPELYVQVLKLILWVWIEFLWLRLEHWFSLGLIDEGLGVLTEENTIKQ